MSFKRAALGVSVAISLLISLLIIGAIAFYLHHQNSSKGTNSPSATSQIDAPDPMLDDFKAVLASYRKIIVLLADEKNQDSQEKAEVNRVGQQLFHDNQSRIDTIVSTIETRMASTDTQRLGKLEHLLDYVESDATLYDADRLAFREILVSMRASVAKDSSLPAIKLHKRISEDLDALGEIEHNYEKEIHQIFDRFDQRAIEQKRERWIDYVAHLQTLYSREQILKDNGVIMPYAVAKDAKPEAAEDDTKKSVGENSAEKAEKAEIFGNEFPKKTIALSFDDGPHKIYTKEIVAILKQYDIPAVFFNVGKNLGTVDANGVVKLGPGAEIAKELKADGYAVGNHSFSHAQLSKENGDALKAEIFNTDAILKAIDPDRPPLFRFPYGARNKEGKQLLADAHLKSVMWNIDSLDWADPIPTSIADRVLREVDKQGKGIILFHDIHDRAIKALPIILDRLVADGYQFAGWDGTSFTVAKTTTPAAEKVAIGSGGGDAWAIVIGINDYAKWPKLQYAVQDAQGVRQVLIDKLGFAAERVFSVENTDATRNGILAAFHDRLVHSNIQSNDRIFVFFAGHGATRRLSSGRDLGYIIPVDSDPAQFETDAIPMTEIQNIAESLTARHVFFVMDACYSGLGLTRGGSSNYLRDNARRIGRQMLTAGGADQMVADGGPNGHSVFTWTLLQGLAGKADLNGDGIITATELAAYVAPAVASVSSQTPAFGSLPGSEGGDFVFELPAETEFIGSQTAQLSSDAITLNTKLDATREPVAVSASTGKKAEPTVVASVTVKDLQGNDQKILPPAAIPQSARQQAQRANDRGLQLYKEKQYSEAKEQFTEALKLRPDFALAANNLGFVYYKEEKYPEAARWFENATKLDPSRAIAYLNLGDANAHAGDKDKARKAFEIYLELAPNSPSATYAKQQLDQL